MRIKTLTLVAPLLFTLAHAQTSTAQKQPATPKAAPATTPPVKAADATSAESKEKLKLLKFKLFGSVYPKYDNLAAPAPLSDQQVAAELAKVGLTITASGGEVTDAPLSKEVIAGHDGFILEFNKLHTLSPEFFGVAALDADVGGKKTSSSCRIEVQVATKATANIKSVADLKDKPVVMEANAFTLNFLKRSPVKFGTIFVADIPAQSLKAVETGKAVAVIERSFFYDDKASHSRTLGLFRNKASITRPGYVVVGETRAKVAVPCYVLAIKKSIDVDLVNRLFKLSKDSPEAAMSVFFKLGRFTRFRRFAHPDWVLMKKIRGQEIVAEYNGGKLPFKFETLP
jgi:hypothetical protein